MGIIFNGDTATGAILIGQDGSYNKSFFTITDIGSFEGYIDIQATNWNGNTLKINRTANYAGAVPKLWGSYTENQHIDAFFKTGVKYSFETTGIIEGLIIQVGNKVIHFI